MLKLNYLKSYYYYKYPNNEIYNFDEIKKLGLMLN